MTRRRKQPAYLPAELTMSTRQRLWALAGELHERQCMLEDRGYYVDADATGMELSRVHGFLERFPYWTEDMLLEIDRLAPPPDLGWDIEA